MGRLSAYLLALALGGLAAVALTSCGDSGNADLLPGGTASEITANLDLVKDLVHEGECIGAEDAAQEVSAQVEALGGVDKQLKQALREGAARLNEVVESCQEVATEETEPAVETAVEPEAVEKHQKPDKPAKPEKPEKPEPAKEEKEPPVETTPTTPAGEAETPTEEPGGGTESPSGGVSPGAPAESE